MNKIYVLIAQENDYDTKPVIYGVTQDLQKAEAWTRVNRITLDKWLPSCRSASISERIRAYANKKLIDSLIRDGAVDITVVGRTHYCWYQEHYLV
jgi:hypothetical protein